METKEIDYTKLHERIVEQAYESAFHLTEEQTRKLIQDKFERARAMHIALRESPVWHSDH
jgi:hypothetical protein